jgi:transketolase
VETMVAWGAAVQRGGPSALLLSRQNLRHNPRSAGVLANIAKGAYVLADNAQAQITLMACGSELELAVAAHSALAAHGVVARVVSMPSSTVFDRQETTYQKAVLGTVPMVVVDAGVSDGWYKYLARAGVRGTVLSMITFGESAPAAALYAHFGLTAEAVVQAAEALL